MRILALALAIALAGPVVAKQPDRGGSSAAVAFTHLERQLIVDYYESHARGGGKVPPGIARKVSRGGSLPPGIARKGLPRELESRLPAPPSGYERVVIDGRVVLVDVASQVIHDVLMDIVVGR